PAGVQGAASDRGAQTHVVVVGLEAFAQTQRLTDLADGINHAFLVLHATTGDASVTIPADLAMTILTVGQRQLHNFKVVGAAEHPGSGGLVVGTILALTV